MATGVRGRASPAPLDFLPEDVLAGDGIDIELTRVCVHRPLCCLLLSLTAVFVGRYCEQTKKGVGQDSIALTAVAPGMSRKIADSWRKVGQMTSLMYLLIANFTAREVHTAALFGRTARSNDQTQGRATKAFQYCYDCYEYRRFFVFFRRAP